MTNIRFMREKTIITAAPSSIHKWFWGRYFEYQLRSTFYRCLINGEENISLWKKQSTTKIPLILYCTHGGWWDAAATIVLSLRVLRLDALGMMEDKQLEKYRFFRKIGMFSVNRSDPRSALTSLHYCADSLRNTSQALWIFPQGQLVPQEYRPVECESGIGILAKLLGEAYLVPVALRYDFLREQRPEMFVRIGKPTHVVWDTTKNVRMITDHCAEQLTQEWDIVRNDVVMQNTQGYREFLSGTPSMEKRFDRIFGKK